MAKSESEKPGFFANNALRVAAPENKVGISGCDHVGLPARDPEAAGRFIEQILGGVEFIKAGYSVRDIELGRPKHIFYHVGDLVIEVAERSEEHTSELQSLMRISSAVFCLKKKNENSNNKKY